MKKKLIFSIVFLLLINFSFLVVAVDINYVDYTLDRDSFCSGNGFSCGEWEISSNDFVNCGSCSGNDICFLGNCSYFGDWTCKDSPGVKGLLSYWVIYEDGGIKTGLVKNEEEFNESQNVFYNNDGIATGLQYGRDNTKVSRMGFYSVNSPLCSTFSHKNEKEDLGVLHKICEYYGCDWSGPTGSDNPALVTSGVCSGKPSCSDLRFGDCGNKVGLYCYLDGLKITAGRSLDWQGKTFLSSRDINTIWDGGVLPMDLTFFDYSLNKGTEVTFEFYSYKESNKDKYIEECYKDFNLIESEKCENLKDLYLVGFRIGENSIHGFIDDDNKVTVQLDVSAEDLKKIDFNGEITLAVGISANDVGIFSPNKSFLSFPIPVRLGTTPFSPAVWSYYDYNNPELLINDFGTVIRTNEHIQNSISLATVTEYCSGEVSCDLITSEYDCESVMLEMDEMNKKDEERFKNSATCYWNNETSICEGVIPCNGLSFGKNECNSFAECSWEKDSLWQRFSSWIGLLFN